MNSQANSKSKNKLHKRQINAEADDRYFSFFELKNHVATIEEFNDKIIYITEEIFNYKQADIINKNTRLVEFDIQCQQLIEQLQTIRALKATGKEQNENGSANAADIKRASNKIRINGPINILTHAYKQMMTTIKTDGAPYLPQKIKVIAETICDTFEDADGNPFSINTIQTYLSPSRKDKDPNNDNSVKF